jgi:chaperone modulatory protein CbpM
MNHKELIEAVLLDNRTTYTFVEVCQFCQLTEAELKDWMAHGLLGEEVHESLESIQFNQDMLQRIRTAYRLHNELEINLQGVILVLNLMNELESVRDELAVLKRLHIT